MKKGKITIIILSILLTISVIGNMVLIIDKKNMDELEEYNPDLQYVGKWEYSISNKTNYAGGDEGSYIETRSFDKVIEIDDKLNITMTETETVRKNFPGSSPKDTTTIEEIVYKGEVKDGLIIFKEKIDENGTKEVTRIIRYIVLYSDDTLAFHKDNSDNHPVMFIKK